MSTHLITDTGELHAADSQSLRLQLNSVRPDFEFVAYTVRNLGFIAYRRIGAAYRLWLRPEVVSKVALAALYQELAQARPERVVMSRVEGQGQDELVGDWNRAVRRIDTCVAEAQDGIAHAYWHMPRDPLRLRQDDPLAAFFGRWRERGGAIEAGDVRAVLGEALYPRHIQVESRRPDGAMVIRSVGGGFVSYSPSWSAGASGLTIDHQPDYYYGKWVGELYKEAFAHREPVLHDMDVIVVHPGQGRRSRVCYRRLMVPIHRKDGVLRMLSASVLDDGIDLRVKA